MPHAILAANLWTMALNLLYAFAAMMIGLIAFRVIDKCVFPQIDFIDEIKKGNIAAAILVGMCLLFLALILSNGLK